MRNLLLIFTFSLIILSNVNAQNVEISGTVADSLSEETLIGANVMLQMENESSDPKIVATDFDGKFIFKGVAPGKHNLIITFVGYNRKQIPVTVEDKPLELGTILLSEDVQMMKEFVVEGKTPPSVQKGDTTQFNAEAFKTLPDASGQDLVEKMPGIQMQDGQLQAQGEAVQQILIDGKPFFGSDVKAALQNLPAEVIASIQVFDKMSDKAELTGFDDGERSKTINIVTKPNRRKGVFGKATAGYGTDEKYQAGASLNFFNNDRRITVTGLSNNINLLNYTADPNSQGESRTQDGTIYTNGIGVNFIDEWGDGMEISGSYSFNRRENEGSSYRYREYVLPSDSGQIYTQNSLSNNINADHRFDMRLDYEINERNRLLIRPDISIQHDDNYSYFFGRTVTDFGPLNQTENTSRSDRANYDFNNDVYYSHRFAKEGRSITLHSEIGYHTNNDLNFRIAENEYYGTEDRSELLNQRTSRDRTGLSWESEISYTEPIGEKGHAEFEYNIGNRIDDSDQLMYDIFENPDYLRLDTALSNTFESEYLTQQAELGYQYRTEKMRVQGEIEYRQVNMKNNQFFPQAVNLQRTFTSFLPFARFQYEFSDSRNIQIDYRSWNDAPSVGQLQDVINNSNPLHLRTGNPNLEQSYTNRIRLRYRDYKPEAERSFYVFMESRFISDNITNRTSIANETREIADGVILEEGSQLSMPDNVDGYRQVRSYISYGKPVDWLKSNFNISSYVSFTKNPGIINDQKNFVNSNYLSLRLSLSSNINEKIDFNISTGSGYNIVDNSLRPMLSTNYFSQTTRFRLNWIFWKGFIYRTDINHRLNTGLSEGYDQSFTLWNMSIGKKFMKNDRAEISLNVYDLLGQNNNVGRHVTELYIEDRQSEVLQRYFMFSFTYNIRHFSKGASMDDFEHLMEDDQ